jgi:hypothetical protein
MTKKIAYKIVIQDKIKEDFVLDDNGEATDEKYSYKEFFLLAEDDTLLERRKCNINDTEENILRNTGIQLGSSAYYIQE